MIIHVLCNDGSPLGVSEATIHGDGYRVGVGGAELALLTMCRLWHDRGHTVALYNSPWTPGASAFVQLPLNAFRPDEERDLLIVFRSPNARAIPARGRKIWWSCDQFTVGDFAHFASFMDKIVCISPFHAEYFRTTYSIHNTVVIDLPVREWEIPDREKVRNRMIFASVPDRGLHHLWRMYPRLKQYVPDLSLTITSDYRLWGAGELNQNHRIKWMVQDGVRFLGAVPRTQYLEELAQAEVMLYPCEYEELFCIAVAEAQAAGVVCVSTAKGALSTTNLGHIFYVDPHNPHNDAVLIDRTVQILSNPTELALNALLIQRLARERFAPERVLALWDRHIFQGES